MDNTSSAPTLVVPVVPSDFEAKCGTSKTDLVRAVLELLQGSKIAGITADAPSPYDLAAISSQLASVTADVASLNQRKIRRVIMQGVNNGLVVVPFQDIGTANYQVNGASSKTPSKPTKYNFALTADQGPSRSK